MLQFQSLKVIILLVIPMLYTSTNYYWGEYFSLNIVEEKHEDTTIEKDLKDVFQDFLRNAHEFSLCGLNTSDTSEGRLVHRLPAGDDFSLLFFSPPELF